MREGQGRPQTKDTVARALDETVVSEALSPVVRERFGHSARIDGVSTAHIQRRLVRYIVDVTAADASDGEKTSKWHLIGKVYPTPEPAERGFLTMQHFWENGFSPSTGDGVSIPEPITYLPDLFTVVMAEIPGPPFRKVIKDQDATTADMRLYARAMAKLHKCPTPYQEPVRLERQMRMFLPLLEKMTSAYPDLADDVDYIKNSALTVEARFGDDVFTLVHGDFHPGNLHITNGLASVLDLDSVALADPATDLNEMYLFLKRTATKKDRLFDYVESLREAFFSEYYPEMGWEIAGRVPLHEAVTQLKRAAKTFRVQDEEDWQDKMRSLLMDGVTCLRAMEAFQGKLNPETAVDLYHACPASQ